MDLGSTCFTEFNSIKLPPFLNVCIESADRLCSAATKDERVFTSESSMPFSFMM